MDYDSVVYMGDFNIHVNNPYDTNTEQFMDMLSALGLDQCVNEATHKQNNTLDLILTDAVSNIRIFNIHTGTYISDHKLIEATLEFTPDRIVQNECKVRNLKNLDMEKFMDTLHLPEICKLETVELIWTEFCTNIQSGLDTCAPLKSIKMGTKNNKLWYDNDLRKQRRKVKNREGIFRKYGEQHQWQAFKSKWNKYSRMLIDAKTKFFQDKISENKRIKKYFTTL